MAKTLEELQELALLISTAQTIEDRRRLFEILRATDTEVDSSDELTPVEAN